MILVVCPNLAVDVTLEIDELSVGAVHRARSARRQAGGKGVNVARALLSLGPQGEPPFVLGYAGGRRGELIREGLDAESIPHRLVPLDGESRTCTILLERDGAATVINESGPAIHDSTALLSAFEELLPSSRAVALMGSLLPGLSPRVYAEMVQRARNEDRYCLVDTSGEALRAALGARPSMVKPNRKEAEELLERDLSTESARRGAVEALVEGGAEAAILTLGEQGFLLASSGETFRCTADSSSALSLGNPTGAGDALAAGFLAGVVAGCSLEQAARLGGASARASLAQGYGRFRARDVTVEPIQIERLERLR